MFKKAAPSSPLKQFIGNLMSLCGRPPNVAIRDAVNNFSVTVLSPDNIARVFQVVAARRDHGNYRIPLIRGFVGGTYIGSLFEGPAPHPH